MLSTSSKEISSPLRSLAPPFAVAQQPFQKLLSLGGGTQGSDDIGRQRDHPDSLAGVDPLESTPCPDLVPATELGRHYGLAAFCDGGLHAKDHRTTRAPLHCDVRFRASR